MGRRWHSMTGLITPGFRERDSEFSVIYLLKHPLCFYHIPIYDGEEESETVNSRQLNSKVNESIQRHIPLPIEFAYLLSIRVKRGRGERAKKGPGISTLENKLQS